MDEDGLGMAEGPDGTAEMERLTETNIEDEIALLAEDLCNWDNGHPMEC